MLQSLFAFFRLFPYCLLNLIMQHGGEDPQNFVEKRAFKQSIRDLARDFSMELNFQEAERESHRAYVKKAVSDELALLLEDQRKTSLQQSSSHFE